MQTGKVAGYKHKRQREKDIEIPMQRMYNVAIYT